LFERWSWPDRGENPNTVEEGQVGGGRAERFRFDYESRKGCGLCVWECPCGAIEMMPKSI
jgi:Pyruvate/2-oxoacid:ferredoxin oxidoreductase delta subunit